MKWKNLENLRLGSIIFVSGKTLTSFLIRKFLNFKYSHVAIYVNYGNIIEADFDGVKLNKLKKYILNEKYHGEILNFNFEKEQVKNFVEESFKYLNLPYDYPLCFGSFISKIIRRTRFIEGLFNIKHAYRCSELVAQCLNNIGIKIKLPVSQITPKDLYFFMKANIKNS